MKSHYSRAFPPPKLLQLPSVSVDISDNSMKYIELGYGKTGLEVLRYGEEQIPVGVVKNGKINDPKRFKDVVSKVIKKAPSEFYRISLPEERAYLFSMPIPFDAGKDPRMAIELSLEERIPMKATEVVFDYELLEKKSGNFMVHVSAVPQSLVDAYVSPFESFGKTVLSLEFEMQAAANAALPYEETDTVTMLVDIGLTRTSIAIISKRTVLFSTSIDIGGQGLTDIIKRSLDVTKEKAEELKVEYGMTTEHDIYTDLPSVITNHVAVLRDEINKLFSYWYSHHDEVVSSRSRIEKILLCGGEANLKGLRDYFRASFEVPVEYVNPWINVNSLDEYIPSISKDKSLSFTSAIGLALSNF